MWWRQQQKPSQKLTPSSARKLPSTGSDKKFFCSTATRAKQIKKCTNFYFNLFKFGASVASVCLASMYSAERWKLNWKTKNIIMKYNVKRTATLPKNPLRVQRGGLLCEGWRWCSLARVQFSLLCTNRKKDCSEYITTAARGQLNEYRESEMLGRRWLIAKPETVPWFNYCYLHISRRTRRTFPFLSAPA